MFEIPTHLFEFPLTFQMPGMHRLVVDQAFLKKLLFILEATQLVNNDVILSVNRRFCQAAQLFQAPLPELFCEDL